MSVFRATEVEITVKDMKTKVVINGEEIVCGSVVFKSAVDEVPTVLIELPVFKPNKFEEVLDENGMPTGSFVEVSE